MGSSESEMRTSYNTNFDRLLTFREHWGHDRVPMRVIGVRVRVVGVGGDARSLTRA